MHIIHFKKLFHPKYVLLFIDQQFSDETGNNATFGSSNNQYAACTSTAKIVDCDQLCWLAR